MAPNFDQARQYILERLGRELSPRLTYHSLFHTRDDVLPAAARLGHDAGLDAESQLLLATAALLHDTGFLYGYHDHESGSIALSRAVLPEYGYSPDQIDDIAGLIAATRMPQRPATPLEALICDADLDVLGRDDFWMLNRLLLAEVRFFGAAPSESAWLRDQAAFLDSHRYFTAAARARRDAGKARNLALLRQALRSANGSGPAA